MVGCVFFRVRRSASLRMVFAGRVKVQEVDGPLYMQTAMFQDSLPKPNYHTTTYSLRHNLHHHSNSFDDPRQRLRSILAHPRAYSRKLAQTRLSFYPRLVIVQTSLPADEARARAWRALAVTDHGGVPQFTHS